MNKNITLFGSKIITVNFEPVADAAAEGGFRVPPPEQIKARQIPIREYDAGFAFVQDEPALVGFLAGKSKAWTFTLTPESYEELLAIGREVNARGFFSYCQRRTEQIEKENAAMIGAMAAMPPETIKLAMEKGMEARAQSRSPILSPGFVSPPVR